jgi:hypothetical protein
LPTIAEAHGRRSCSSHLSALFQEENPRADHTLDLAVLY